MRIGIIGSARALAALGPLREAYEQRHHPVLIESADLLPDDEIRSLATEVDALLLVGKRRHSPRTACPGPLVSGPDGRIIPVGWLPDVGVEPLGEFARTAAKLHRRAAGDAPPSTSVAILGQWNSKYLNLANRIERCLSDGPTAVPVLRWTSDQLIREDMVRGVGTGVAVAIYVGHGRPVGWVGYRGTRIHHFDCEHSARHPVGLVISLACLTASRRRTALSFAEALPLSGVAAAAFGAVTETQHSDNARWALRMAAALKNQPPSVGSLIAASAPPEKRARRTYRLLGDPLAPLLDAPGARRRAADLNEEIMLEETA